MKMRIQISHKNILLKEIREIIIDDKKYFKNDFKSSLEIQNFYTFIKKNSDKISFIIYETPNDVITMRVKNKKLHSLSSSAYWETPKIEPKNMTVNAAHFYIDGKELDFPEWNKNVERKRYIRLMKLKRIKNYE